MIASSIDVKCAPRTGGVRFAPSPTGRFHLGNLRTAWISWRIARSLGLPWVVRFEDIDRPRVLAGARETQAADMAALGLTADIELLQSDYEERHWQLFSRAVREGQVYACDCSRKEVLAGLASAPHDGVAPIYSGRCRARGSRELRAAETLGWRFVMPEPSGAQDFIIARSARTLGADGLPDRASFVPAYHWACAIDDSDGGYDWLVRSWDLASAAPLQRAIQKWLGKPVPRIFHTSLITQNDGHRLEKRTPGVTLPELSSETMLHAFAKSFTMPALESGDAGESAHELRLVDLGL